MIYKVIWSRRIWILLCLCMAGACTTTKSIDTAIAIDAKPCAVYDVLADFDHYPDWNPYHIDVAGALEVGAQLKVRVSRPDGKVIDVPHVRVLEVERCRTLVWGGGVSGVFRGEHRFDLVPGPNNITQLSHTERFQGLFIGFADLPVDVLTQGYETMNEALKVHIEADDATDEHRSGRPSVPRSD
ncbi:MAG: SRPBCC domain-containing protein [Pseudomonadota bacterium]